MVAVFLEVEAENSREKTRSRRLVARRHYGVVENDRHRTGLAADTMVSPSPPEPFPLLAVLPPGVRDGPGVARLCLRPAEHVPVCEPMGGLVPMRNPIAPAADDPIECLAGRQQSRPAVGCDDTLDQCIDDRIRDAAHILRPLD